MASLLLLVAVAIPRPAAAQGIRAISLQPTKRLDQFSFSGIRGVVEMRDGRLLVSDQTEKTVWAVDPAAGTRTRIGHEGSGPNEFASPVTAYPYRDGGAIVVDFAASRLAILDSLLHWAGTLPLVARNRGILEDTDTTGAIYYDVSPPLAARRRGEVGDTAVIMRWLDGKSEVAGKLRLAPANSRSPFPDRDEWAVSHDGRVAVARNQEEYRLDWYRRDGSIVVGQPVDEERIRLTGQDRQAWLDKHSGAGGSVYTGGGRTAGARPAVDFPEQFPYAEFFGVFVDRAGRAWVSRYHHLDEDVPLYDVFDGAGRRIAQVRLPAGRKLIGFGEGVLYAFRTDDVGLQWLEIYALANQLGETSPAPGG